MKKYGTCEKCGTPWSEVFPYNDMWLCKTNNCYDEEVEKNSGKHIIDEEKLEEYRALVEGTKGIPASVYSAT